MHGNVKYNSGQQNLGHYLALAIFLLIIILQCALIMAVIFVFLGGEYFLRNREFPFLPFFAGKLVMWTRLRLIFVYI